ncbi:MAG: outer membrane protein assembly factor BamA [Pseudomonadota bacterium]
MRLKKVARALLLGSLPFTAAAFEPFVVKEIDIVGLQRVDVGVVHTELPIKVGERVTETRIPKIIRSLFKTGAFEIVEVNREGSKLIINVSERPTIASIDIEGNNDIKTDDLLAAMESSGISDGEVLNPAILEQIQQELERQYYSYGKYGVKVSYKTVRLARNRVRINIKVFEGDAAVIKKINIVGNKVYSEEDLLSQFELTTGNWLSFFTDDNQYAKEKLSGDLETLRSYYHDRGYVKFQIVSTQVSITPDKEGIYITININEGDIYKVSDIKFSGDLILSEPFLKRMVPLNVGDTYSGAAISYAEETIGKALGFEGYAFANISPIPEIDEETKQVSIVFFIDPGKRTYVNRINFSGNEKTQDQVLRREMRLMEGGKLSTSAVERSKMRLERLPFVEQVSVETPAVQGTDDMVDINFNIKERAAGSINGGIGYNELRGAILTANISQSNFMGSGKTVSAGVSSDKAVQNINLSYTDPYFTPDGVSNSYSVFFRKTDFGELNIAGNALDSYGGSYLVGIPLSELMRLTFGLSYQNSVLKAEDTNSFQVIDFFNDAGQNINLDPELDFELFTLRAIWSRDSLNRGIFPDRGTRQTFSGNVTIPGSEFEYYKLDYDFVHYVPITRGWTVLFRTQLSFGDGYGSDEGVGLPYFENFFAGGSESLRGFESNTVGPRELFLIADTAGSIPGPDGSTSTPTNPLSESSDTILINNRSVGGNARVLGGVELIFPTPFADEDNRSIRTSAFVDIGNVWDTDDNISALAEIDPSFADEIADYGDKDSYRVSVGISVQWISPLGPLKFSFAKPIEKEANDRQETIGFNVGRTF